MQHYRKPNEEIQVCSRTQKNKCNVHTLQKAASRFGSTGQASRNRLSHQFAEMDSLPTQSVQQPLKRSLVSPLHPSMSRKPQPVIWIVCVLRVIWIVIGLADRLMHNSKEHAEQARVFWCQLPFFSSWACLIWALQAVLFWHRASMLGNDVNLTCALFILKHPGVRLTSDFENYMLKL